MSQIAESALNESRITTVVPQSSRVIAIRRAALFSLQNSIRKHMAMCIPFLLLFFSFHFEFQVGTYLKRKPNQMGADVHGCFKRFIITIQRLRSKTISMLHRILPTLGSVYCIPIQRDKANKLIMFELDEVFAT